jgi:phytoene desaturase
MGNSYDALIIGSGVGGLCAGALLAYHGYHVLLVEKRNLLGGRFSTMEDQGFKLPTGAAMVATRGIISETYRKVGAPLSITELGSGSIWMFGQWHELPEKGQIHTLLSLLNKTGSQTTKILAALAQGAAKEKIQQVLDRSRKKPVGEDAITFRDWLLKYTDDERTLQLFHTLTSTISTVNDFEYPASHWFTYVSSYGQGGMKYHGISGAGNLDNANSLADTIRLRGGKILLNAEVCRIDIRNNEIIGLQIKHDNITREISPRFVISDIGPRETLALCDTESLDETYTKQVANQRPAPIVANYVASDIPLTNTSGGFLTCGTRRIVAGVPLSNFTDKLCPPGQHLLVAWGTPASCKDSMNVEEEARLNLEDLREVFPDFTKHGRLIKQDFRNIDNEFPALRNWMGWDLPVDTPLGNLFLVGDAVKPFGWEGLAACAQSAVLSVKKIKRKYPL